MLQGEEVCTQITTENNHLPNFLTFCKACAKIQNPHKSGGKSGDFPNSLTRAASSEILIFDHAYGKLLHEPLVL